MLRRLIPWLTAALVIVLDRVTKLSVLEHLEVGSYTEVFPGLALTHVHNTGIAFSLFSSGGWFTRILIHAVILLAVVLIGWMLVRHEQPGWLTTFGFGLILGGALGNLFDRVLYGWVIDFIHVWARFGERTLSWPDFNVADSAITVGACILVLHELRAKPEKDGTPDAPDSD